MGKKIRSEQNPILASELFTDRKLPREAFWKNYNLVKSEIEGGNNEAHVLTYYGVGGIGKSSLLRKLETELQEKVEKPLYVRVDLNDIHKEKDVLCSIRNTLVQKYKYKFSLFDFAMYHYSQKMGISMETPDVKSIIDNSEFLSTTFSVLGAIPVTATAAQIVQCAEKGIVLVANFFKEHEKECNEIDRLGKEELEQSLSMFFSMDMCKNLKKTKEPLVIMLDTYECLVNEMSAIGESLNNDLWLRGEKGLILNIPKTLWVISGRERIKWDDILHEGWDDSLEQHLLGELSENDAILYLEKAGVLDEKLRNELFKLTNGTPIYLDICVQRYNDLKFSDVIPNISDFGQDTYTLIERFARYMDDNRKDLVYMLACLGKWTDEMVFNIIPTIYPAFSMSLYEKVKGFSFITCNESGVCSFQRTVSDVFSKNCPLDIKKRLLENQFEFCSRKIVEISPISDWYAFYMEQLDDVWHVFIEIYGDKDMRTIGVMEEIANAMQNAGQYADAVDVLDIVYGIRREILGPTDLDTIKVLNQIGLLLKNLGDLNSAFKCCHGAYEKFLEVCGEDDILTLAACKNTADILRLYGRPKDALSMYEYVYDKYVKLVGEAHHDTIDIMLGMAYSLVELENNEAALLLFEEVQIIYENTLSKTDVKMINVMYNKAICIGMMGDVNESYDLLMEVFELSNCFLGTYHPSTMKIAKILDLISQHS